MLMQTTAGGPPPASVDDTVKSTDWVGRGGEPCTDVTCVASSVAYINGCKVPCATDDPECWGKFLGMADNRDYCELPPATMEDCATKLVAAIVGNCGEVTTGPTDSGKEELWGTHSNGTKCEADWNCTKSWLDRLTKNSPQRLPCPPHDMTCWGIKYGENTPCDYSDGECL